MASTGNAAALPAIGVALLVASCASTPEQVTHSPKAQKELAVALAGRTAARPVTCIKDFPTARMQVIDDWTVLFHQGSTIYVQNPRGGCQGLDFPGYTLITHQVGTTQICSGDIARLVQQPSGMAVGSCIFSPFVPYIKPE